MTPAADVEALVFDVLGHPPQGLGPEAVLELPNNRDRLRGDMDPGRHPNDVEPRWHRTQVKHHW